MDIYTVPFTDFMSVQGRIVVYMYTVVQKSGTP